MSKNKENQNAILRYKRFNQYEPFFIFEPEINNKEDLAEHYNKEIKITHKLCGHEMNMVTSKWMSLHTVNRGVPKENYLYLCNKCSKEIRNSKFQNFLDSKYKGDFVLVGDYAGDKKTNILRHMSCGNTFEIVGESVRKGRLTCKICKKSDAEYEKELQTKRDNQLKEDLKKNGLNDFIPLDPCQSKVKAIRFKHLKCGNVFEKSPQALLKFKNKDICPKCDEGKARSRNQQDRNEYFQAKLDKINGEKYLVVGDYKNLQSSVLVKHIDCGKEFRVYAEIMAYEKYPCPHCESNDIKNNRYLTISEKIECYEDILDNEYKILTPFIDDSDTISIRHESCGHIFSRTVTTFVKSKGRTLCPECRKQNTYKKLLGKLHNKYGNEYKVVKNIGYSNNKRQVLVMHNKCNRTFGTTLNSLLSIDINHCPYCSGQINSTEKLKERVFEKYNGEYLVVSEYINSSVKVDFRHKNCGKKFSLTSRNFMNYKTPCPYCRKEKRNLGMKNAQSKANAKFGNLFTLCGEYKNVFSKLPIKCNACGEVIEDSLSNLLKRTRCVKCKAKYL